MFVVFGILDQSRNIDWKLDIGVVFVFEDVVSQLLLVLHQIHLLVL